MVVSSSHLLVLDDPVLVKVDEEDVAGHQAALLNDLVVRDIHHADLEKGGEEWEGRGERWNWLGRVGGRMQVGALVLLGSDCGEGES